MAQLFAAESNTEVPERATKHAERWLRLQEERRFRAEQLAALEVETCATDRHESVKQALRIAASTALKDIDAALDRIVKGRYGRCVDCGRDIPDGRLDVLPMAALCMACHYNEQNLTLPAQR